MAYNIIGGYPDVLRLKASGAGGDDDIVSDADSDEEVIIGGPHFETFIGGLIAIADGDTGSIADSDDGNDAKAQGGDEKANEAAPDVTGAVEKDSSANVTDPDMAAYDILNDKEVDDETNGDEEVIEVPADNSVIDVAGGDEEKSDSEEVVAEDDSDADDVDAANSEKVTGDEKSAVDDTEVVEVVEDAEDELKNYSSSSSETSDGESSEDEAQPQSVDAPVRKDNVSVIMLEDEDAEVEDDTTAAAAKLGGADMLREVLGGYFELP